MADTAAGPAASPTHHSAGSVDRNLGWEARARRCPRAFGLQPTRSGAATTTVRRGTTSLFPALDTATGKVFGSRHRRHWATEFNKLLAGVDERVPAHLDVHPNPR